MENGTYNPSVGVPGAIEDEAIRDIEGVSVQRKMGDNFDGHLLEHLREIEEAAEEVLSEKQEIVDLDRKRNQNREAIRALSRPQENSSNESNDKAWLAMGNCFFELPKKKALNLLEQDQVKLDSEINSLRSDIKVKVNNLRDKPLQPI